LHVSLETAPNAIHDMKRLTTLLQTPRQLVTTVGFIVLTAEFLIMLLINALQPLFNGKELIFWSVADPIGLAIVVSPVLYTLIFRPMRNQQIKLEAQLDVLHRNEQLAALIEAIPDAVFLKDGDGRWVVINEPAKQLFQLQNLPWQGKTEMELAELHPAFRTAHEACLASDEKAWQSRQLLVVEERLTQQDGRSPIVVESRKAPIFDNDGRRKGLAILARDVTERQRAEQELRIAATTFEAQEAIVVTDPDHRILRVNGAFTRMTGYSAMEVIGRTPAILKSERQDAAFYRSMWDTLNRDKYWEGELWNRRKDGLSYLEWLTVTAVTDANGQVTHYVGLSLDITLRKEADEKIHQLAFYDPLTKLPNRRLLQDRLQQALGYSMRHKNHGAILFIDLDNFKLLNDTRGHDMGDLLLIEVAKRLQDIVRGSDTVARLGGDEFIAILGDLSQDAQQSAAAARDVGEKVLASINQPFHLQGVACHSSASIGISLFRGDEIGMDDLLKHADAAMYQAKTSGHNTLRFFDPAMQAELEMRAALTDDLRQALPRQQFKLHYQIQVNQQGIVGAEALLRWQHPGRGLVSPMAFIPLAEETGLIVPIGAWVLQLACAQLKAWQDDPQTRHLQLAVNISARQFRQPDLVEQVLEVLKETGIDPVKLELELTESLVLDNIADAIVKMRALRDAGIRFSLDDFGTGRSSLSYLKLLPLDQIKIDQSFVRDIATDPNDAAIVRTIIGMANNLGLNVIAEGVETEQQRDFLERNGCHAYQGYLFGKPVPIEDFQIQYVRPSSCN
jgi:diguanylate cyclase (GGDEF)-like protein/PAS domain S-box-containing protein